MWQSHTPAGTWHPAESHILGSVFLGHTWSLPAEPPHYQSDTGSGPVRPCSGPLSPPGCIPGNLSTMEEEIKICNDDSLEPGLLWTVSFKKIFLWQVLMNLQALLLLLNQRNPKPKWSPLLELASFYPLYLFLLSLKYSLLFLFLNHLSYDTLPLMRQTNKQKCTALKTCYRGASFWEYFYLKEEVSSIKPWTIPSLAGHLGGSID